MGILSDPSFDAARKQTWEKLRTLREVIAEDVKEKKLMNKKIAVNKLPSIRSMEENCESTSFNFPITKTLRELERLTEEICKEVIKNKFSFREEPINFADLHCVSSEYFIDMEGYTGFRVYIEEASPTCTNLRAFIRNSLKEKGHNVEVVTEW